MKIKLLQVSNFIEISIFFAALFSFSVHAEKYEILANPKAESVVTAPGSDIQFKPGLTIVHVKESFFFSSEVKPGKFSTLDLSLDRIVGGSSQLGDVFDVLSRLWVKKFDQAEIVKTGNWDLSGKPVKYFILKHLLKGKNMKSKYYVAMNGNEVMFMIALAYANDFAKLEKQMDEEIKQEILKKIDQTKVNDSKNDNSVPIEKYSIKFPKDWTITEEKNVAYFQKSGAKDYGILIVKPYKIVNPNWNEETNFKSIKQSFVEKYNGEIRGEGEIKIGKKTAKYFIMHYVNKGRPLISKTYILSDLHRKKVCYIDGTAPQDEFKKYESIFDKSAKSFYFK
ncbi:MAG: hypothetical protein H7A32_05890 [Deltaproteobacteria bacterium]|nr:hypothetical protein [Deltaproteobacteria bacterium]